MRNFYALRLFKARKALGLLPSARRAKLFRA